MHHKILMKRWFLPGTLKKLFFDFLIDYHYKTLLRIFVKYSFFLFSNDTIEYTEKIDLCNLFSFY